MVLAGGRWPREAAKVLESYPRTPPASISLNFYATKSPAKGVDFSRTYFTSPAPSIFTSPISTQPFCPRSFHAETSRTANNFTPVFSPSAGDPEVKEGRWWPTFNPPRGQINHHFIRASLARACSPNRT
ncbi:hypothetical protein PGTUg99_015359 [Puccinia graminis f. sp. tritici]|uniref:Uncharacterized protein n=1 Tax=Puccinia graminis f. sp. tritici TaxID=56615 RepID=A0A5B0RV21_PUCGR|nr:hypothetical protein PGTUg99_015359 [Puccinia graminis f. sp. tritici]